MNKISSHVNEILKSSKITSLPIDLKKIARHLDIQIKFSELEDDISGFLYLKNDTPTIFINNNHPDTRKRFTIAHEIGHYLLNHHGDLFIDKSKILYRNTTGSDGIIREEREANRFAAELLMPEEKLIEELNENEINFENEIQLNELAEKFGVSTQALTIRLTNLGWSFI